MAVNVQYSKLDRPRAPNDTFFDDASTTGHGPSRTPTKVHWRAPTVMCGSFVLGCGFAVAHHFFYAHWNGMLVENAWSQVWIVRIATALAFLTKLFLAISSSVAYVQQQWSTMHAGTYQLGKADTMFGILSDATLFLDLKVWFRHPLLSLPALVTWLVPLAAVITPGSLTVHNGPHTSVERHQVPQLTLNGTAYGLTTANGYLGVQRIVERLGFSTAFSASIPQLPYPGESRNASYELTYFTPAIQCEDASAILAQNMTAYNKYLSPGGYVYFSYVPSDTNHNLLSVNGTGSSSSSEWRTIDRSNEGVATLYIATMNIYNRSTGDMYYIKCELWNATQTVNFNFTYPTQNITVQSPLVYNQKMNLYDTLYFEPDAKWSGWGFAAAMDMFGEVFAGGLTVDHYDGSLQASQTNAQLTTVDWSSIDTAIPDLEQVFQNMTLSYMTDSSLIKNSSVADFVDVTVLTYQNTYVYDWRDLVLAYGIAGVCALVCLVIGLIAMISNHASYSNKYSSIVRSFRGSQLEPLLSAADVGADPLPKRLKKAELSL